MFFVFYILVFITFSASKTSHSPINPKIKTDELSQNDPPFSSQRPLFEILRNRKGANLKSNVFDKMLSDEMYSIKQHFHDKDMTFPSSTPKPSKFVVKTPTLDVKQRWLVMEITTKQSKADTNPQPQTFDIDQTKLFSNQDNENSNSNVDVSDDDSPTEKTEDIPNDDQDKNLGLRSLPEISHVPHVAKYCTCMKTNPSYICNHKCTGGKNNVQTCGCIKSYTNEPRLRTTDNDKTQEQPTTHKCTRNNHGQGYPVMDPQYSNHFNAYQTYQPVMVYTYYEPDVIGDIKIPNQKKYKQKPYEDNVYYEENKESAENIEYEDYPEHHENGKKIRDDLIDDLIEESNRGVINNKVVPADIAEEHDELVENLVNDLREQHNDVLIKHCYCSSAKTKHDAAIFSSLTLLLLVSLQYVF